MILPPEATPLPTAHAPGHHTSYQRVPSSARWSGFELGCAPTRFLLDKDTTGFHRLGDIAAAPADPG
jgi:hypothetical protein